MFQQITILGPGLLGASLALAVKAHALAPRVVAWSRREETRVKCQSQVWCDAVFETPEAAVVGSDLVIVCTPVDTIVPLLNQIQGALAPGVLLTDVGSTKSRICRSAGAVFRTAEATFIGSHPMAGSAHTGLEHARADLFQNAACILTPLAGNSAEVVNRLNCFWQALGMRVSVVSPEEHDAIVAHISHLPHLLASTLCSYLSTKDLAWRQLGGGGLRDTTRVASGDPDLWQQILGQNRSEVLRAIEGFEAELQHLKASLLDENPNQVTAHLQRGKDYRDPLNG